MTNVSSFIVVQSIAVRTTVGGTVQKKVGVLDYKKSGQPYKMLVMDIIL